jgi:signal transduction histidine kinase
MDALRATLGRATPAWNHADERLRALSSRSPPLSLLRGLTVGRVGLVLLICALLSWRQIVSCVFEPSCNQTLSGAAWFVTRHFLAALPLLLAVTIADNATAKSRTWMRIGALAAAVTVGAAVFGLAFLLTQPPLILKAAEGRYSVFFLTYFSRAFSLGGLATGLLYYVARERADAQAFQASRLAKLSLDRQTTEARLQALQAQIEPHFLFNTLANIRMLYDAGSTDAKSLVRDLSKYLETAIPQIRDPGSTLGREIRLVEAYLGILKVRMGERLGTAIDVPDELEDASFPPMMLSTLVENAVKHGINPRPSGGKIRIHAERRENRLQVSVIDNGVGFPSGFGSGVGLANTRARLAALDGDAGRLELDANPGGGVIARIELPYRSVAAPAMAT